MKKSVCVIILNLLILAGIGVFYSQYLKNSGSNTSGDAVMPMSVVSSELSQNTSPLKTQVKIIENVIPTPEFVHNSITSNKTNNKTNDETNNKTNNEVNKENNYGNNNGECVKGIVEKHGLVELVKLDDSFVIDIKYATTDNFTGKKIYTMPICLIHKNVAQKLINANNEFKALGYRIKVFDAYRPYSAQQVLWDAAQDKSYVANPKNGSVHNRGAAVDITLVDKDGNEISMPSGYDEFSKRSHLDYNECVEELIDNRELLGKIMVKYGFKRISKEWWHFDDTDAKTYPILDIPLEEFLQEN